MRIVGFVPAKGESERVKNKNMQILDGEFLFHRKLRQMVESTVFDEVWLDTESDQIASHASDLPVKILKRLPELATNKTDGHELFSNECRNVAGCDIYVQALCTAPFVDAGTFRRAIDALKQSPEHDSLVAVTREAQYLWSGSAPEYGSGRIPNSIDLCKQTIEAMSLYAVRATSSAFGHRRFGARPLLFELSAAEKIDINWAQDLQLAEAVCAGQRQKEAQTFRALAPNLNASVIADVTKELGLACVLPQNIKPVSGQKFLGRAKTLKLSALPENATRNGGEWRGIYKALNSYAFIRSGDVIVVSTEVPDRAYFGELNAHLAVRAGAVGVIVDGFTRDVETVRTLGLPVYARGVWGNDIKYEGTTAGMNEVVFIGDVPIRNNDIIFADENAVIAIPQELWNDVLARSIDVIKNETQIRINVVLGMSTEEILNNFGAF